MCISLPFELSSEVKITSSDSSPQCHAVYYIDQWLTSSAEEVGKRVTLDEVGAEGVVTPVARKCHVA